MCYGNVNFDSLAVEDLIPWVAGIGLNPIKSTPPARQSGCEKGAHEFLYKITTSAIRDKSNKTQAIGQTRPSLATTSSPQDRDS